MIKLYALTCFAKYPQFQLLALGHKDKDDPIINASSTLARRGRKGRSEKGKSGHNPGKGRGQSLGKGRGGGRGKGKGQRYNKGNGRGHNTSDEKTTADKTKINTTYNASSPAFKGECSYCGIYGHMSRDCRKRIAKETKSENTHKHTRVTAASVTFDADDDDETTSLPDDETSTFFQSVIILESNNEDTTSDDNDQDTLDPYPEHPYTNPDDNVDTHTQASDNGTALPPPLPDDLQSSSITQGTPSTAPYEWGKGTFYPHWGIVPPPLYEDPSWGENYTRRNRQERNEVRQLRNKVFQQGGSPPPKIEEEDNLFGSKNEPHTPHSNTQASDDLAFRTGPRKEGIVKKRRNHTIRTHPNPFEKLNEEKGENALDESEETTSSTSVQQNSQRSTKNKKPPSTPHKEKDKEEVDMTNEESPMTA